MDDSSTLYYKGQLYIYPHNTVGTIYAFAHKNIVTIYTINQTDRGIH